MPEKANSQLFTNLRAIGNSLAAQGRFNPNALKEIAYPERFPTILGPLFRIFLRTPVAHFYFDQMLKDNGAYQRRFARPFLEPKENRA